MSKKEREIKKRERERKLAESEARKERRARDGKEQDQKERATGLAVESFEPWPSRIELYKS